MLTASRMTAFAGRLISGLRWESGTLLPAMGYGDEQLHDLESTIAQTDCEAVVIGTPIDLRRVIRIDQPSTRVFYDLQEIGVPTLNEVLDTFMEKKGIGRLEAVGL